jgi:hypothetical protein
LSVVSAASQAGILRLRHRHAQRHAILVEIDDDHLQADARDLLRLDSDDLADAVGRVDHEIAGLEPHILFFCHNVSLAVPPLAMGMLSSGKRSPVARGTEPAPPDR